MGHREISNRGEKGNVSVYGAVGLCDTRFLAMRVGLRNTRCLDEG